MKHLVTLIISFGLLTTSTIVLAQKNAEYSSVNSQSSQQSACDNSQLDGTKACRLGTGNKIVY